MALSKRKKPLGQLKPYFGSHVIDPKDTFSAWKHRWGTRSAATASMAAVRMMTQLTKDKQLKERIVPIIPDEGRTFGMAFFMLKNVFK